MNMWRFINRCIVCGSHLKFERSTRSDAKPEEGVKYCEKNHRRFSIFGGYDDQGNWQLDRVLPLKEVSSGRVG